ncbi:glycosyltransferase family 4 protein [Cupriavidus pinatubonensis]|uniref:D-inositol-3-phosphate glycosyltransferase n=1 Tax=Cupriavidus pinatubonensis TaxID=248026 RepID=A0ABN7Y9F1_9BURK|nr:glycosyltransferase family 4 protein [Cupriavidus pinatubonensis]CAG9168802.1 D-inositol-3-phosphate glycosyltransferase [Cupriavidus pinatubonensis]
MSERILVVHNAYQQRGGEDAVVEAEIELLRSNGHEVATLFECNDDLNAMPKLEAAQRTFWSYTSQKKFETILKAFKPHVLHAHNTFPLISPSIFWSAHKYGIPVIQTLHNFRLHCPQATYLRNGVICEDCLGSIPWRAAVHGCYRESRLQSGVLAAMQTFHRAIGTWSDKVTRYIALNNFCRNKFIEGGLPADRIRVKPNFCEFPPPAHEDRSGFLFVGRLSQEKGIATLRSAARLEAIPINVIGDGPEKDSLADIPSLACLGKLPPQDVRQHMCRAEALVMPSNCYEGFPMVIVEAFAAGLPVIASRLGSMLELVEEGSTGLLFEAGNAEDLAAKMRWAAQNPERMREMGRKARATYEPLYSAKRNYQHLIGIYREAIESKRKERTVAI